MKHHFISGMKVAANGLQRKSFLVPSAVLQIDPVDLPPLHTQLFQRHAPQEDRRFPDLPHHSIQLGTIQRKQMPPVEAARKHRRLRESLSDRKSVVQGTRVSVRVDLGGRRYIKKKRI